MTREDVGRNAKDGDEGEMVAELGVESKISHYVLY